jgi:CRISPR-associated protein Csx14
MAEARIPVDLRNPGQVFACLGFMEAAEAILGQCCEGGFDYTDAETQTAFTLSVADGADPILTVLRFLTTAKVTAIAPKCSALSTQKWDVPTEQRRDDDPVFPCPAPDSPAALPMVLRAGNAELAVDHWTDGGHSGRDNVKFWAGAAGYPGAALARDALAFISELGDNAITEACADPFSFASPMSSSFRFDWRRDYIPLDAGFTVNAHAAMIPVGYPIVEVLAAVGLQNARPARVERRDKLAYRYAVSSARLPTVLARAVLGGQGLGFPIRLFRMRLGWPGQEGQARCIIDAQEEFI